MPVAIKPLSLIEKAEQELQEVFKHFDEVAFQNQTRVMEAFRDNRLSPEAFIEKTGYGLGDYAREVMDAVYAQVFEAPAAAVRMQFVSGTHAITCAMAAAVKVGERMVCLTGKPYDTVQTLIGLAGNSSWSFKNMGIDYEYVDIVPHLEDEQAASTVLSKALAKPTAAVHIQRSRGYNFEGQSLGCKQIERMIKLAKKINPKIKVFIDNCYGEFVEPFEPVSSGADIIAGSLIKNPGGGLAITGGYIAGSEQCVNSALERLTAPGLGGHLGISFNQNRWLLQGLFMAPSTVSTALKSAALFAYAFQELGFEVTPGPFDKRYDIVQTLLMKQPEPLIRFCRSLQKYSVIDSHVQPEPAPMPGYDDKIIMAGGTFVAGSTIELSCDGPLRPPYAVYLQGGLNYQHVRYTLNGILQDMSA